VGEEERNLVAMVELELVYLLEKERHRQFVFSIGLCSNLEHHGKPAQVDLVSLPSLLIGSSSIYRSRPSFCSSSESSSTLTLHILLLLGLECMSGVADAALGPSSSSV
jgi:hypothetical protein